jgi:hypothetical protein
MVLPAFTPVFRAIDQERRAILEEIEGTAQEMIKGGILYDAGLEYLMKKVSDLERLEFVYEDTKKVELLVEEVLPEKERYRKLSDIIEVP